jgi:hypothetical protein
MELYLHKGFDSIIQEHLANRIWPLKAEWSMLKPEGDGEMKHEVNGESLVRLDYE